MAAYLLLLVAVLSRLLPHAGWMNFTAVGGALLYFGARRSWREMLAPLAVLMATDYYPDRLRLPLQLSVAGLSAYVGVVRDGDGAGADSAAGRGRPLCALPRERCWGRPRFSWSRTMRCGLAAGCIRARWAGWALALWLLCPSIGTTCISTAIVAGLAFGVPVLVRRMHRLQGQSALAEK